MGRDQLHELAHLLVCQQMAGVVHGDHEHIYVAKPCAYLAGDVMPVVAYVAEPDTLGLDHEDGVGHSSYSRGARVQVPHATDRDVAEPEFSGSSQQRRTAGKALDRIVVEVVVGDQRHVGLDSGKGAQEPVALRRVAEWVDQDSDTLGRSPKKGAVSVVGQRQESVALKWGLLRSLGQSAGQASRALVISRG